MLKIYKVVGKGYVNTANSQTASIGAIFSSSYHKKQLNLWSSTSASCVENHSSLYAYPREMELFKDYPSTRRCLTSLRSKPQKNSQKNFQYRYLAELLASVYSCVVWCWKCVLPVVSMEASFSHIQSHIVIYTIFITKLLNLKRTVDIDHCYKKKEQGAVFWNDVIS